MGSFYSILYESTTYDDIYSEIDEYSKEFVQCYCMQGKEYNVNIIVLLQHFQKYLLLNIDNDIYEKWCLAYSPKGRFNFILKNLDSDKYVLNDTHIIGIDLIPN